MRDIELLVRFFAFHNFVDGYNGNLKLFFDNACGLLNTEWTSKEKSIRRQADAFEKAVALAYETFDQRPFRKWEGDTYEDRFNRAIFDIVVYYFSNPRIYSAINSPVKKTKVSKAFKSLCEKDASFIRAVETTTKSK